MKQILRLANIRPMDGGLFYLFDLITEEDTVTYRAPVADIGDYLAFFADVARATHQGPVEKPRNRLTPVPANGLGLRSGPTPDTNMVVVNVAGFGLAFQMPRIALADALERIARSARTLSAGGTRQ
jgi:hypothetical protein